MGSHTWLETCPACGYDYMDVGVDHGDAWSFCEICGYRRYTVQEDPTDEGLEIAKRLVKEADPDKLREAIETIVETGGEPLVSYPDIIRVLLK